MVPPLTQARCRCTYESFQLLASWGHGSNRARGSFWASQLARVSQRGRLESRVVSERRIGWGILGCGGIATTTFAPAVGWSKNGKLVAVASRDPGVAREKARALSAGRAYAPYESLLADLEVEAVYIGLPNGLHEEWATRAAAAKKHVLCEKSLTLSPESARRLSALFAASGLRLVEAFMYRHHPQWNVVRQLLAEQA